MQKASALTFVIMVACGGKLIDAPIPPPTHVDAGADAKAPQPSGGHDAGDGAISISADAWLAFDSDRDGTRGIYLIRPDGTGLVRVTKSTFVEKEPAFSPDGTKLAYTSNASGEFQIHIVDLATQTSSQLTARPNGAAQPTWSRDGSLIAFIALAPPPTSFVDSGAPYTPPTTGELFIIRPDGTGETDVLPVDYAENPVFGPDPSVVIYGGDESIHAIGIDGTNNREIAGCMTEGTETPAMSPDGSLVMFATWGMTGEGMRTTAFTGDCVDPLHDNCSTLVLQPSSPSANRRPAWGPNDVVAYETGMQQGPAHIALFSVSAGTPIPLTTGPADDRNPAWAPSAFKP